MDGCVDAIALFLQLQNDFTKRKRFKYNEEDYDDDDDELIAAIVVNGFERSGASSEPSFTTRYKKRLLDRHYAVEIAMCENLDDFQVQFHVKKDVVEVLESIIGKDYFHVSHIGRRPLSLRIAVLIMIWTLGNRETYRSIGARFQIATGHAHRVFMTCCRIVSEKAETYFRWPKTEAGIAKSAAEFEALHKTAFLGVAGCVGGTHIPVKVLLEERHVYVNQKGTTSIIVQAVCDANLKFTDVFAGWPGSYSKATVWRNSPLCKSINPKSDTWLHHTYLLGNAAYPVTEYLLTPYRSEHLSQKQLHFNTVLNSAWVVIKRAFGLLKSRFHRLKRLEMKTDLISNVITAACVIHNICLDLGDIIDIDLDNAEDVDDNDTDCEDESVQSIPEVLRQNRDNLADYLFSLSSLQDNDVS